MARTSSRAIADLYVDGRATCRLPCQTLVPAGAHRFEGRAAEGNSTPQDVYLTPGATTPLFFEILPARASIRVATADPNTLIYLDGTYQGKGAWQGLVSPGRHVLLIRRSTGEVLQQALDAAAGMTYAIRDNPAPKSSGTLPAVQVPPPVQLPAPATTQASSNAAGPSTTIYNPQAPQVTPPYGYGASGPGKPAGLSAINDRIELAFRGITGAVFAPVILGGPSTSTYGDHCPATEFGGSCTVGGPRGGAIALQLGYSYGWIAPEAMLGLSLDISSAGLQLPAGIPGDTTGLLAQILSETKFVRTGILGGLGARMSTLRQGRRFTFSGVFGFVKRSVYIIPDSLFGSRPSYTAPTLFFDTGVVLGDTPGVKVYAGLFLWLEFIPNLTIGRDVTKIGLKPEDVPDSVEKITPFDGTQVMFGPFVGVTFGH